MIDFATELEDFADEQHEGEPLSPDDEDE